MAEKVSTCEDRSKCIFCKICDGKCENAIKYEDENYIVFDDIRPAAPHHYLVVTRKHYKNITSLKNEEIYIINEMVEIGKSVLMKYKNDTEGLRMGFHWPPFHTVSHLHLHVIASETEMGLLSRLMFKKQSFYFVSPDEAIEWLQKRK